MDIARPFVKTPIEWCHYWKLWMDLPVLPDQEVRARLGVAVAGTVELLKHQANVRHLAQPPTEYCWQSHREPRCPVNSNRLVS